MTEQPKKFYGVFDTQGAPQAFYVDDLYLPKEDGSRNDAIPAAAVEISEATWTAMVANHLARFVNGAVTYIEPTPTPPPEVPAIYRVTFDHENRIRAQEGAPPLTMADFVTKLNA
jgi:hypothetical protein